VASKVLFGLLGGIFNEFLMKIFDKIKNVENVKTFITSMSNTITLVVTLVTTMNVDIRLSPAMLTVL